MTYTLFFHLIMNMTGLWPKAVFFETYESPEEQILMQSLCIKCGVSEDLPKEEKLEGLQICLK